MHGRHDTTLYLKAQVDNLTGHNEELRRELRETRFEATKATVSLDKASTKVRVGSVSEVSEFWNLMYSLLRMKYT